MKVARFAGIVDVPIFSAPDLGITDYVGFDASPRFSTGNYRAPLFSYQPQTLSTNDEVLGRVVSMLPNLNGPSITELNGDVVPGFSGMSARLSWFDDTVYMLNELPPSGTNYRWRLFKYPQTRKAGIYTPPQVTKYRIDSGHPFTAFGLPRIEFQSSVLRGYDWASLQILPQMIFCQNTTYGSVYSMVLTWSGLRVRNAFVTAGMPGITWPNFVSGSSTAFTMNERANSFLFGRENRPSSIAAQGLGYSNYLFVGKGLKLAPVIVNWRTTEYDPVNIITAFPRWDYVSFDDAYYTDKLATARPQGYKDGFIFIIDTPLRDGRTGQLQEAIVTDPIFNSYYILRFVPQNPVAAQAMETTNTTWSVMIDTEGTVWFYNGGSPGFTDTIFNSYSPALFFNPRLIDFDLPAVVMPCYNTCMPGYF